MLILAIPVLNGISTTNAISLYTPWTVLPRDIPPVMRHAHNGYQHEPLRSEIVLPVCRRLSRVISGW